MRVCLENCCVIVCSVLVCYIVWLMCFKIGAAYSKFFTFTSDMIIYFWSLQKHFPWWFSDILALCLLFDSSICLTCWWGHMVFNSQRKSFGGSLMPHWWWMFCLRFAFFATAPKLTQTQKGVWFAALLQTVPVAHFWSKVQSPKVQNIAVQKKLSSCSH